MRGINSESVDLIYLDPPFNSNRNYDVDDHFKMNIFEQAPV